MATSNARAGAKPTRAEQMEALRVSYLEAYATANPGLPPRTIRYSEGWFLVSTLLASKPDKWRASELEAARDRLLQRVAAAQRVEVPVAQEDEDSAVSRPGMR